MTEDAAETTEEPAEDDSRPGEGEAEQSGESLVDDIAGESSPSTALGSLAERLREVDDELASEADGLADRVADLETEVDELGSEVDEYEQRASELESKLKRKQAEFENYKKRAERKREEIRERATEDFVGDVVTVRDDLVRALEQAEDAESEITEGLQSTLAEFDRLLAEENVEPIEPEPGTETDPARHEVLMRAASDRPEGEVVDLYRPGYEMAGRVIQTAQVTVSDGSGESEAEN